MEDFKQGSDQTSPCSSRYLPPWTNGSQSLYLSWHPCRLSTETMCAGGWLPRVNKDLKSCSGGTWLTLLVQLLISGLGSPMLGVEINYLKIKINKNKTVFHVASHLLDQLSPILGLNPVKYLIRVKELSLRNIPMHPCT